MILVYNKMAPPKTKSIEEAPAEGHIEEAEHDEDELELTEDEGKLIEAFRRLGLNPKLGGPENIVKIVQLFGGVKEESANSGCQGLATALRW